MPRGSFSVSWNVECERTTRKKKQKKSNSSSIRRRSHHQKQKEVNFRRRRRELRKDRRRLFQHYLIHGSFFSHAFPSFSLFPFCVLQWDSASSLFLALPSPSLSETLHNLMTWSVSLVTGVLSEHGLLSFLYKKVTMSNQPFLILLVNEHNSKRQLRSHIFLHSFLNAADFVMFLTTFCFRH